MVFLMFPCNYLTTLPAQKDGIIIKASRCSSCESKSSLNCAHYKMGLARHMHTVLKPSR